jgi:hypothetical protein
MDSRAIGRGSSNQQSLYGGIADETLAEIKKAK